MFSSTVQLIYRKLDTGQYEITHRKALRILDLLTIDLEMSYARDLSGLIESLALVHTLVLWEGASDVQRVDAILRRHLEVLGWLDGLVVVIPLKEKYQNMVKILSLVLS